MSDCALPLIPDEFLCYFEILYFVFLYSSSPSGQNGKMLVNSTVNWRLPSMFLIQLLSTPLQVFLVYFLYVLYLFCFFICCPMSSVSLYYQWQFATDWANCSLYFHTHEHNTNTNIHKYKYTNMNTQIQCSAIHFQGEMRNMLLILFLSALVTLFSLW